MLPRHSSSSAYSERKPFIWEKVVLFEGPDIILANQLTAASNAENEMKYLLTKIQNLL